MERNDNSITLEENNQHGKFIYYGRIFKIMSIILMKIKQLNILLQQFHEDILGTAISQDCKI